MGFSLPMENIDELLEQERKLNEVLVRFVCHNLANPLTVVKNYIYLLKENRISPEDISGILERMELSNQAALDILAKVRRQAQIRNAAFEVQGKELNLKEALNEAIALAHDEIEKKGLRLEVDFQVSDTTNIWAHTAFSEHVIFPLISNAIKFSNDHELIKITASEDQAGFLIQIRDFGMGLKHDHGMGFGIINAKTYLIPMGGKLKIVEHEIGSSSVVSIPRMTHTTSSFPQLH